MTIRAWIPHLHSLQTLITSQQFTFTDELISHLWDNPALCPKLTTIDSFAYPGLWSNLRDCIEKRNHLAMQDPSVHPVRTLRFPLEVQRNISDRLKESLSGVFAGPFVAIPLQRYALEELIQPDNKDNQRPGPWCFGCIRSGNAFECLKPGVESQGRDQEWDCARHSNRGPDRGVRLLHMTCGFQDIWRMNKPQCACYVCIVLSSHSHSTKTRTGRSKGDSVDPTRQFTSGRDVEMASLIRYLLMYENRGLRKVVVWNMHRKLSCKHEIRGRGNCESTSS